MRGHCPVQKGIHNFNFKECRRDIGIKDKTIQIEKHLDQGYYLMTLGLFNAKIVLIIAAQLFRKR